MIVVYRVILSPALDKVFSLEGPVITPIIANTALYCIDSIF